MTFRVLALGAGVQSTTVLLLALRGEIEPVRAAIFSDTGWEPVAVYEHLERLKAHAEAGGIPVHVVRGGDIRDLSGVKTGGSFDAPFYMRNRDGTDTGTATRQCTRYLKIRPMRRRLRELMRAAGATEATQVFGISADEFHRMRDPDAKFLTHDYPLVDMRWTRHDCKRFLAEHWPDPVPRSACIGCPFHSDHEWRAMRDDRPAEFAEAVEWERAVQLQSGSLKGIPYVHRSRVPLDEVDLSTPEDYGQLALGFGDECEGMCGV